MDFHIKSPDLLLSAQKSKNISSAKEHTCVGLAGPGPRRHLGATACPAGDAPEGGRGRVFPGLAGNLAGRRRYPEKPPLPECSVLLRPSQQTGQHQASGQP